MKKYRVLAGYEWVAVAGNVLAGEIVELPEHEAIPFLDRVLELVTDEESEADQPKKKKASA